MSIRSGNFIDLTPIGSGDTILINPTIGRVLITLASLHEQTGASETVELFISPDATSAAGERVDILTFSPNETKLPISINGLGIKENEYLIAKGATGNLVAASITYTQYSGDS